MGKSESNPDNNDVQLQNILTTIFIQAVQDGIITPEEKSLLDKIKIDMRKYKELLNTALEDGIITDDEEKALSDFRKRLLRSAYEISRKDHNIDRDEREIISLLVKLLIHHESA